MQKIARVTFDRREVRQTLQGEKNATRRRLFKTGPDLVDPRMMDDEKRRV
jgi:hypothetical protein